MKGYEPDESTELLTSVFKVRLKEIREERGLTQKQLSLNVGVSANAINNYELGTRNPSAEILRKIAINLNISADYLLGLSYNRNPLNSDITFEDIADAVIKLFSLEKVQSNENGNIIEIKDKHLAEFVEQFMKMRDFIFSSDCPDYAKTSLKRTIIKNFSKKFCITNGVITLTPEYTAETFSEDF